MVDEKVKADSTLAKNIEIRKVENTGGKTKSQNNENNAEDNLILTALIAFLSNLDKISELLRPDKCTILLSHALMFSVIVAIVILAILGNVDSSGAAGLLGAIIGYVFGSYFHKGLIR